MKSKKPIFVDLTDPVQKEEISKKLNLVEFIDLSSDEKKEEALKKLGFDVVKTVPYVVCPLCALSRPLRRSEIHKARLRQRYERKTQSERSKLFNPNKEIAFDLFDVENGPFISIRVSQGRRGFTEKAIITFRDVKNLPERDQEVLLPLIKQIRAQCKEILKATDDLIDDY